MSTGPTHWYLKGLECGELRYQFCSSCRAAFHRPRITCPTCGEDEYEWRVSAGIGVVYSVSVVAKPPGNFAGPRRVALVDLEEGFRMIGQVEQGVDKIGSRTKLQRARLPDIVFVEEGPDTVSTEGERR